MTDGSFNNSFLELCFKDIKRIQENKTLCSILCDFIDYFIQ